MLNGNTVATLTFNQLHGGHQHAHDGSMFDQSYQQHRDGTSGISRGRAHGNSIAGSS